MVVIELLKAVMIGAEIEKTNANITQAFLKLFRSENRSACEALLDEAIQLIDDYMTPGESESIYNEPECLSKSKDIKGYMRWEQLGKNKESSPKLLELLALHKKVMKHSTGGQPSRFEFVFESITTP